MHCDLRQVRPACSCPEQGTGDAVPQARAISRLTTIAVQRSARCTLELPKHQGLANRPSQLGLPIRQVNLGLARDYHGEHRIVDHAHGLPYDRLARRAKIGCCGCGGKIGTGPDHGVREEHNPEQQAQWEAAAECCAGDLVRLRTL